MKFEFAKYTEITDLAFEINEDYKNSGYVRIFICPDVWDFWLVRILKGYNTDYEKDSESYILERDKISMSHKGEKLTIFKVKDILIDDEFENWDYEQGYDIDDLIDMLDDGFGILNLKK